MASDTQGTGTPGWDPTSRPEAAEPPASGPSAAPAPAGPPASVPQAAPDAASWGAPPPAQGSAAGGWATQAPPQQPPGGQWGAPPPQQPGAWAPPPGAAGGPPANWAPQPSTSNNGCLKACLIVGGIIAALGILLIVAIGVLGMKFASDMGFNADGSITECEFISTDELTAIVGGEAQVMPLGGLVDATIGQVLDKRVLADAPDCWLVQGSGSSGTTGRLARQDTSDAAGMFASERSSAETGGYFATAITGVGDEAFCTGVSNAMSVGVLARSGGRLAYVSLIDSQAAESDYVSTDSGVVTSPSTCDLAGEIAQAMLR